MFFNLLSRRCIIAVVAWPVPVVVAVAVVGVVALVVAVVAAAVVEVVDQHLEEADLRAGHLDPAMVDVTAAFLVWAPSVESAAILFFRQSFCTTHID